MSFVGLGYFKSIDDNVYILQHDNIWPSCTYTIRITLHGYIWVYQRLYNSDVYNF